MNKIFDLLKALNEYNFLSGYECTFRDGTIPKIFLNNGAKADSLGNIWIEKRSENPKAKNILIEAHLDVIGFVVKEILDGGFLSVSACGGFDFGILPGTDFYVHSKKRYKAFATSIPPHLLKSKDESSKSLSSVFLDCGFSSKKEAEDHISVGSPVLFSAPAVSLSNDCICSPYLDNKAAVIALLLTLEKVKSPHNIFFLFSAGEETTSRGVKRADIPVKPDLAFVVDAGFAFTRGLDPDRCIEFGMGPSVSIADTLSRGASNWVISCAERCGIALQVVVEPGGTGTSATALQLRAGGVPCALISIPIKYMHTPSEVVCESDIVATSNLLKCLLEQHEIHFEEVLKV